MEPAKSAKMLRRKVHAQRKFAQGAHIPSVASTSTQKLNNKTQKDDNLGVFISTTTTSATHLLDILSLKDSHEHLQPFVLLERLPNSTKSPQKKIISNEQENVLEPKNGMCLRQSTKNKYPHQTYKCTKPKPKLKRSLMQETNEDETPLLYLKSQNTNKKAKKEAEEKKKNKISPLAEKKTSSTTVTNITDTNSITENVICDANEQIDIEMNALNDSTVVTVSSVSQFHLNETESRCNETSFINTTALVEIPPNREKEPQPSTSFANNKAYYNLKNKNLSEKNYSASNQTDHIFEVDKFYNTQVKKKKSGSITVCVRNEARTSEVCPSRKYSTYQQVICAETSDLAKQCHSCIHCKMISIIQNILNFYTVLITNCPIDEEGDYYICVPANRQDGFKCLITYFLSLPPELNAVIELNLNWDHIKHLEIISADLIPIRPDIQITYLNLEYNYELFVEMLDFITKCKIQCYKFCPGENTLIYIPKTEYIESSGDESEPEYKGSIINEENIPCLPSVRVHNENPASFPMPQEMAQQLNAPEFHPSVEEFMDPIQYFNNIMPIAAKFGICKVVAPRGYKPQCILDDSVRFTVTNQYISRLFRRWGSGLKELCAIKAYLASQSVHFNRPPLLDGMEVNLPKLYSLVQSYGGLPRVIAKKRWAKIAEEMRLTKTQKIGNKLDKIYVKYILPYDTLSQEERKELMKTVETHWEKKHQRMLKRALKPLHRQKRLLGESETSEEEVEDDIYVSGALNEAEDCITKGRLMKLSTYQKVAYKAAETYLQNPNTKNLDDIEKEYWRIVTEAKEHICVNSASIDTGEEGYGFTKNLNDPYSTHPWNLKVLSHNHKNVLKSLGPVVGVTVPTLHLGMTFSTSCWHRDPHGLPWIEYMHSGPGKIWYGIPDEQSNNFRSAVEKLCPTSCQKKTIWLPSDIVMIPPDLLLEHQVSLSRVVQKPGEYVIVFPKAYSCSVSTGYTESESVYFAPYQWINTIDHIFMELRESCEPTMFSLEQLLLSVVRDPNVSPNVLRRLYLSTENIIRKELANRLTLARYKVQDKTSQRKRIKTSRKRPAGAWNVREQEECGICQTTLYLSRVFGLTDKKQSVCLQHALELLNRKQWRTRDLSNVGLEVFLTETELERVITNIHLRIQNEP